MSDTNEYRKEELTGNLSSLAERITVVHKEGHEGIIQINTMTGHVLTLLGERPEWAEELTVAQIAERHAYYSTALGDKYTTEMVLPEMAAFEDFAWTSARAWPEDHDADLAASQDPNYDGFEHYETEASSEFRSGVVATVLGITGDIEQMEAELLGEASEPGSVDSITADLSTALIADSFRSQEELEAMDAERRKGFDKVSKAG